VSGSGTNALTFSCMLKTDDSTPDLVVTEFNLPSDWPSGAGASIVDGAGNDLSGSVRQPLNEACRRKSPNSQVLASVPVKLTMMEPTNRNREFVADLAPECTRLRIDQVM
jgi:hypothetical protein